ncbi:hypothetical protein ACIA8O_26700 [Kitasatospora sp. NPDC051853]|uniref:hypothetical protein n=1 Tax=Kitasatospora sp. NPDC051853 TaxID=3364058 RepID=UPI0037A1BB4A
MTREIPGYDYDGWVEIPDALFSDGQRTLPVSAASQPLAVVIQRRPGTDDGATHTLRVYLGSTEAASVVTEDATEGNAVTVQIPPTFLQGEGDVLVRVEATNNTSGAVTELDPVVLTIDRTPPGPSGQPAPPELTDPDRYRDGLTTEVLNTLEFGISATLPPYPGAEPGDLVQLVIEDAQGDLHHGPEVTLTGRHDEEVTLVYPVLFVAGAGDGTVKLGYWLFDKAGNQSPLSKTVPLVVKLNP